MLTGNQKIMPSLSKKKKTQEPAVLSTMDCTQLRAMLLRYPYYDEARVVLLRKLYEQRNPEYNEELRTAALYLPSRETIFEFSEGERMKPKTSEETTRQGAIQSHKPNARLSTSSGQENAPRDVQLIDSFLDSLPTAKAEKKRPQKRPTVDSSVDYISYMLQEEEEEDKKKDLPTENTTTSSETNQNDGLIEDFIKKKGDRRIRLNATSNESLERPNITSEESSEKSTFTETLAQIYIKQGKFEQAIEIIQRLSLKFPKKNRYFADQIRFLEKVIINQKANQK
ncbi:MAG: tetratricopeptide repeat protein [Bacteroidales bacterium]|nr:tetratricopeptide repeat protein [Candidatus Physcousia equi]